MRPWLFAAMIVLGAIGQPASACRSKRDIDLTDVRYADVVLVGRVSDYRVVRDEVFRQERLSDPNLSLEQRERFGGTEHLLPDYARFEVEVDEVLLGSAPRRVSVTWDNSTFGEPQTMDAGPFLIALHPAAPPTSSWSKSNATTPAKAEPGLMTLLQAACTSPFLFPATSEEANAVRRLLGALPK